MQMEVCPVNTVTQNLNFNKTNNLRKIPPCSKNKSLYPLTMQNYGKFVSFGNSDNSVSRSFYKKINSKNMHEKELFLYTLSEAPTLFLNKLSKDELKDINSILKYSLENDTDLNSSMKSNCKDISNFIEKDLSSSEQKTRVAVNPKNKTMNIISNGEYPSNILSNFYEEAEPFYVDGVACKSMEGFLQSLKVNDSEIQSQICLLSGICAKRAGKPYTKQWQQNQTLYWQGKPYNRHSQEYADLVKKAFYSRYNASKEYRKALKASKGYKLTHTAGYNDPSKSILTTDEFLEITNNLRDLTLSSAIPEF